jgi:hypothetical protein
VSMSGSIRGCARRSMGPCDGWFCPFPIHSGGRPRSAGSAAPTAAFLIIPASEQAMTSRQRELC